MWWCSSFVFDVDYGFMNSSCFDGFSCGWRGQSSPCTLLHDIFALGNCEKSVKMAFWKYWPIWHLHLWLLPCKDLLMSHLKLCESKYMINQDKKLKYIFHVAYTNIKPSIFIQFQISKRIKCCWLHK